MLEFLTWLGGIGAIVTIAWFLYWWIVERPRNRANSQPPESNVKPLVYADRAGVTGFSNVDVQLHNESDHLATNINIELRQGGALIGSRSIPTIGSRAVPPRTDLMPPGTGGLFVATGVEWMATCTYQGPDGRRWRSIRVSRPGNTGSTLDFEPL